MSKEKIISIDEYYKSIENSINEIIKDSTYPELSKYIKMLPNRYDSDDNLYSWGFSYINEYYKVINSLDSKDDILRYKIYILYLKENYTDVVFTFDEFITFSKILNNAFLDYNPNKERESDRSPFESGNKDIDYIVNKIAYNVRHSEHPHAYEISKKRLNILLDVLNTKRNKLLEDEISKINLDDNVLNKTLSKERIKKLRERIK